jgi:hypothetical protein
MSVTSEITPTQLRDKLNVGVTKFFFQKKNGELRTALGTTNLDNIPNTHHPKGVRPAPDSIIPFFDLEKQAWRAISVESKMWSE